MTLPLWGADVQLLRDLAVESARLGREGALQAKRGKLVRRAALPDGRTLIVKLWRGMGARSWLRQLVHRSPLHGEMRVLRHLAAYDVDVPRALGCVRLPYSEARYRFALLLEDVGPGGDARPHVADLMRRGDTSGLGAFEDQLARITRSLIEARVTDSDHTLYNIVLTPEGRPVRLDFETARIVRSASRARERCGPMLAALISSYAFVAQPDTRRVAEFARKLAEAVEAPAAALRRGREGVERLLEMQRRERGIDTRLDLPW